MTTVPHTTTELEPHETYTHGHHWRNAKDEAEAAKLGMWLFLSTEILLFAGFFCAYGVFRALYPGTWVEASHHYLDWRIGGFNTVVLLISSFTIVMAIRGATTNRKWMIVTNLIITNICAAIFLILKLWLEYWPKIKKDELPGANFNYAGPRGRLRAHLARPHLPLHLLARDRDARLPRPRGHVRHRLGHRPRRQGPLRAQALHIPREHGPVLAHRRRHLDLPLPPPVPRLIATR